MPLPLKALWYSPANMWLVSPLVFISSWRTFLSISEVSMLLQVLIHGSWHFHGIQYFAQDVLAGHVLGFCFVGEAHAVAHHVETNAAYVFRYHVSPAFYESVGFGSEGQVDGSTGRTAVGN